MEVYWRETPERIHRAWLAWLEMQWERPDKRDWYAAAVACTVARANAKNPGRLKVKDFLLKFGEPARHRANLTPEQATAISKARWAVALRAAAAQEQADKRQ